MKFAKPGKEKYYELSDCGRYTVAATSTAGKWLFGAWILGKPAVCLGQFAEAEDARNACRADAKVAA